MTTRPDLKIVDQDVQRLHLDLEAISQAFTDDTRVAADVSGAFGHQRLADEFSSFSESWRVNRERVQKNIDELAKQMGNIKVATDEVDKALAGDDTSTDPGTGTNSSADSSSSSQGQATSSSSLSPVAEGGGGGQPGGASGSGPAAPLPGTSAGSDGTATTDPGTDTGATPGAPTADETMVRVGEDGDFYAAVTVGGAGAVGATATLMALYKLWDAHRAQVSGVATPTSGAEQADARTRLLAGLEELGANGNEVTVELVSEGQSPDHVMAILRGEDGSVSVLDLSPDEAAGGDLGSGDGGTGIGDGGIVADGPVDGEPVTPGDLGADDAAANPVEAANGAEGDGRDSGAGSATSAGSSTSTDPLPEVGPSSGSDGGAGGAAGGSAPATAEPLSALSSTDSGGSTTTPTTGWSGGSVDVLGSASAPDAAAATVADEFSQDLRSPHVAGTTAGMGMAGMGAVSAAGMGGHGDRNPSRGQAEPLRKMQESADDESEEEQR